jgi:hypothetical protein
MSSRTGKDFDHYARDCVKLASGDNVPPELRSQLLEMAREWMQAAIEEEGAEPISRACRDSPSTPSQ